MNLIAKECFKKGSVIPAISWKDDSATSFGDYLIEFDFPNHRVFQSACTGKNEIASIQPGHKGRTLHSFFGTVEVEEFVVTSIAIWPASWRRCSSSE
jgi:hypothetical protein